MRVMGAIPSPPPIHVLLVAEINRNLRIKIPGSPPSQFERYGKQTGTFSHRQAKERLAAGIRISPNIQDLGLRRLQVNSYKGRAFAGNRRLTNAPGENVPISGVNRAPSAALNCASEV